MAKFVLSAFADEYSPMIDEQIVGLKKNGIGCLEIRGVDGTNIADISTEKAKEVKKKLDDAGIKVMAIGSPIGKIRLDDSMKDHLVLFRHVAELAHILDCERIRMFSFYVPDTHNLAPVRDAVMERLEKLLSISEEEKLILCHENERGIYGETVEGCLDILNQFEGKIKCIFDPANFVTAGIEAFPYAFNKLKDRIFYLHIKDAGHDADGTVQIFPAGDGAANFDGLMRELRAFDKVYVCTMEPHLQVFAGLGALEMASHDDLVKNRFSSNEDAFCYACDAFRRFLR